MTLQDQEQQLKQQVIESEKLSFYMMNCGHPESECRRELEKAINANRKLASIRTQIAQQKQRS